MCGTIFIFISKKAIKKDNQKIYNYTEAQCSIYDTAENIITFT